MLKQIFGCTALGIATALTLPGCGNDNGRVDTPAERAGANATNAAAEAANSTANAARTAANDITGAQPADGVKTEAQEIMDEVRDEAKDIKNEIRDFFVHGQGSDAERLNEYIEEVDEQLEEYQDRIEDEQDNTRRVEYTTRYEGLRSQRDDLRRQWENLKDASAEQWADAKAGLNRAMNRLSGELREFGNNFRDAVTPDPAPVPAQRDLNTPGGVSSPATGNNNPAAGS